MARPPKRQAGESVRNLRTNFFFDAVAMPLLVAMSALVIFGWETFRHFSAQPPNPILMGLFCLPLSGYCAWRAVGAFRQAGNYSLGLQGEQRVAEVLEELPRSDYRVYHDLVPDEPVGNIDHIVVGPSGIYVIETKTMRKHPGGSAVIDHPEENQLLVSGKVLQGDPLGQVERLSQWMHREIKKLSGLKVPVQAVLVFPGWQMGKRPVKRKVWVLNDSLLNGAIRNQQPVLSDREIQLIATHLDRSVREGGNH